LPLDFSLTPEQEAIRELAHDLLAGQRSTITLRR